MSFFPHIDRLLCERPYFRKDAVLRASEKASEVGFVGQLNCSAAHHHPYVCLSEQEVNTLVEQILLDNQLPYQKEQHEESPNPQ